MSWDPTHPVAGTVGIYVAVTATTGNVALVFAAGSHGDHFLAATLAERGDLGFDRDASLLVNPHDSCISQVRDHGAWAAWAADARVANAAGR